MTKLPGRCACSIVQAKFFALLAVIVMSYLFDARTVSTCETDGLAIGQSDAGMMKAAFSRKESTSLSIWFAIGVFALALGVVFFLFWRAYDQKRLSTKSMEASSEEPRHYFKVAVADMPINHYTHVEITGKVTDVRPEKDGDAHIQVSDGANFIIAECIPKLPCSVIPEVGQMVTIRGISRYDRENHWYEVHPVEEIEVKK